MLIKLARFSKLVAKYGYYPVLIGAIAALSAYVYRDKPQGAFAVVIAAICAILCVIIMLKNWLCKLAGEDNKIK